MWNVDNFWVPHDENQEQSELDFPALGQDYIMKYTKTVYQLYYLE